MTDSTTTTSTSPNSVPTHGSNGYAVGALVAGIVSLVFCWGGWLFVAVAAAAVTSGVKGGRVALTGRGQRGLATAGVVLGSLSLVMEFVLLCSIGRP